MPFGGKMSLWVPVLYFINTVLWIWGRERATYYPHLLASNSTFDSVNEYVCLSMLSFELHLFFLPFLSIWSYHLWDCHIYLLPTTNGGYSSKSLDLNSKYICDRWLFCPLSQLFHCLLEIITEAYNNILVLFK